MLELPPIIPTKGEQALMDMLTFVARRLSTHQMLRGSPAGQAPIAVKGGTGLALGLGLTRPSTDLDIDVSKRNLTQPVLADAVHDILQKAPNITVERCDVKQHGHGYMRLWVHADGISRRLETKIDMQVCDGGRGHPKWEPRPTGINPDHVTLTNGMSIYKPEFLIPKKLNTLIGARARRKARDIYDAAWILCHYPDAVPKQSLERLQTFAASLSSLDEQMWQRAFTRDDIMTRADFTETWCVLMERLDVLLDPKRAPDQTAAPKRRGGGSGGPGSP